jgi:hypothetical protein
MANEIMSGLFGMSPEDYATRRDQQLQQQALQFAQLSPAQQAQMGFYTAGGRIGGAVGGLLGVQDPELMRVKQRQSLLQGIDLNDPAALRERASVAMQQGDVAAASQLAQRAMAVEEGLAKIASEQANQAQRQAGAIENLAQAEKARMEATKIEGASKQEEELRKALSQLPADASDKDVENVVRQFGNPDKILAAVTKRQEAEANRIAKAELEREKAEERARRDQEQREFRMALAALSAQQRSATNALQQQLLQTRIDDLNAKQEDKAAAAKLKQDQALNHAAKVITDVQEATGLVNGMTTGLTGKTSSLVPGTDAYNLNQRLLTIKANLGFDRLQQMRDASPTGGALGQVAVQELNALQSTVGSLEIGQDRKELVKNLEKIDHHYQNWIRTTKGEKPITIEEYRKQKAPQATPPAQGGAGSWSIRPK